MLISLSANPSSISAGLFLTMTLFTSQPDGNAQTQAKLPNGVKAVWEPNNASLETTSTRERICINGLWLWQPADLKSDQPPSENWGYFKVPGSWPGITNYMQKDSQKVFAHPNWKSTELRDIRAAWYQREITIPAEWNGRSLFLSTKYLNSFAAVYVDGTKAGEMRFPKGEVDLTALCRPGERHILSLLVLAMPLNAVMNPELIDGINDKRSEWAAKNVKSAGRAETIVSLLDPSRIVYHHASGNLGPMHTINFYPNFVPIQEMSDWFGHWATNGVKPAFTCEFGAPFSWDWTMYRGWYEGKRTFGSAKVPWEFCLAEWNAQFIGDSAYRISEQEKTNLRWEAKEFSSGRLWHRWDYPHPVGSRDFDERYPIFARYLTDNWRAFRTWGLSATSPWEHGIFWKLQDGVDKGRQEIEVDWEKLQRPGFSPDYIEERYERMDLALKHSDWIPTEAAKALIRNNGPLLAYIGGKPGSFTSKDHNFLSGETLVKQLIVINNSRVPTTCDYEWTLSLPQSVMKKENVRVETGNQARIPIIVSLPENLPPDSYRLKMTARFSSGETQEDEFAIHLLPRRPPVQVTTKTALFDPLGETGTLLREIGIRSQSVNAGDDLTSYELLIVGKGALTISGLFPTSRTMDPLTSRIQNLSTSGLTILRTVSIGLP